MNLATDSCGNVYQGIEGEPRHSSTEEVVDTWLSNPAVFGGF